MANHTPGPWMLPHFASQKAHHCMCGYVLVEDYCGAVAEVFYDNGKPVGEQGGNDCPPMEEAIANARLITASPDLLRACIACEENLRMIHEAAGEVDGKSPMPSHSTFETWKMASDAIAKALKGEEEDDGLSADGDARSAEGQDLTELLG